jgi:CheY-like chemotaxis protein
VCRVPQVLVVDDDRAIRDMLRIALEVEGYGVSTFRDGSELLDALARMDEPAIVLLDLMMPGVSGWEVCARLESEPLLFGMHRVIAMTAGLLYALLERLLAVRVPEVVYSGIPRSLPRVAS